MQRDFEHVTIAHVKDGTWRVCVQWTPGDPLHCYTPEKAARLAADARAHGDHELSGELHAALRDVTASAAGTNSFARRPHPMLVADPDDAKGG